LQVQFNIIDLERLKDMMLHPDNYPERLMVRVSGYTAYFQDLNPQMQQEIITRAEYDLVDGYEHRYQDEAALGNLPTARKIPLATRIMFILKILTLGCVTRLQARKFVKNLEEETTEELLETLLRLMRLAFWLNPDYRRNIEDFTGSYRFKDRQGVVDILVGFSKGEMKISSQESGPQADVTVTFKDSAALLNFLIGGFSDDLENLLMADSLSVWDMVHFNFGQGLRKFLVAQDQAFKGFIRAFKKDVLQGMLNNEVQVCGNLNYLYKFGFLANYPIRRLLNLANKIS
jgi:hypothetical protein